MLNSAMPETLVFPTSIRRNPAKRSKSVLAFCGLGFRFRFGSITSTSISSKTATALRSSMRKLTTPNHALPGRRC